MKRTEQLLTEALEAAADQVRADALRPLVVPARPRPGRRLQRWLAPVAAAVAVGLVASIVALMPHMPRGHHATGKVAPFVRIASSGVVVSAAAIDSANHTIYVPGYFSRGMGGVLTMIDTRRCNVGDRTGCAVTWVRTSVLGIGTSLAVSERTHTLYATDYVFGGQRVPAAVLSVLSTDTCRAGDAAGCTTAVASVRIGAGPPAGLLAINQTTNTIYVERGGGRTGSATVSVIDGRTCNATSTRGCAHRPATIRVTSGGFAIAVDEPTNTLYVGSATGVAVIGTTSCDAHDTSGCGRAPHTFSVGGYPTGIAVDDANHTLYVGRNGGVVSVVDRDTCDAATTVGCGRQALVPVGTTPLDNPLVGPAGTIYVANRQSDTVSMINATTCAAAHSAGCASAPSAFPVGLAPGAAVLDQTVHTIYVPGYAHGSILSMISSQTCAATSASGCPSAAPASPVAGPLPGQACGPTVLPETSGGPAQQVTADMIELASGTAAGQPWSLWARRGEPQPRAIEDGGMVLNGRWYGLCTGYSNAAEMELIDAPGAHGIVYGLVTFHFRVRVRLSIGQSQYYPPVTWLKTATFFVGALPRPACAYPSMRLHATYHDVPGGRRGGYYSGSAWHQLSFGNCSAGRVVSITDETGSMQTNWGVSP